MGADEPDNGEGDRRGDAALGVGDRTDYDHPDFAYVEFGYLHENCDELGRPLPESVEVERVQVDLPGGGHLSALRWGRGDPEFVFLHGGAQNAHTWDSVVLAMGVPAAICIDLPGHGHSSWRDDGAYDPRSNAESLAVALDEWGWPSALLVGMSLGGLTANSLAAGRSDVVERVAVVDVTPGVDREKAATIHAFIEGPQSFPHFGALFERTVEFNPTRSATSLRRGILHNAFRRSDGQWEWRYDRRKRLGEGVASAEGLWSDVADIEAPYLLLRGALSPVVDDADEAELRRLRPDAVVCRIEGAGHSIQGDRPADLAAVLSGWADGVLPPEVLA